MDVQSEEQAEELLTLLTLPAEIRNAIFQHIFNDEILRDGFFAHNENGGIIMDPSYRASDYLRPFSACKQLYADGNTMAWNRISFISNSRFGDVRGRLCMLNPHKMTTVRNLAFVADAHHFRDLVQWNHDPFGLTGLQLDTLTIILHSPGGWHYLFDFTAGIVSLLRRLQNVKRIVFVRNGALVKGGFRTWYNRLIGLIMKVDHFQRYDRIPSSPEGTWWSWEYEEVAQTIGLKACPPRPLMGEEPYMLMMKPLMEGLKASIEYEEKMAGLSRHDGWGWLSSNIAT